MSAENMANLIAEFSDGAIKHHELTLEGNYQEVNKQAHKIDIAFKSLVKQGISGREALLSLTESENAAIALMAATYSLKYAPDRCKVVLKNLAQDPGLIGFGASQILLRWEEGTWSLE